MALVSVARLLVLLIVLFVPASALRSPPPGFYDLFPNNTWVDRSAFPDNFSFGALSWAIKHEAAVDVEGKSPSIWDVYSKLEGKVWDSSTPRDGGNQFYQYEEDIQRLLDLGMDTYRFSIAWTRMFPNGSSEVSPAAVEHYNGLIDSLIAAGIEPYVTLYEQDMPQTLQDAYGGLLSPLFIDDFVYFAIACFSAFGDRVKHWFTFDEGNDFIPWAFAADYCPPGRCSVGIDSYNCTAGNSSTEPYIAGHNMLLAHAAAVDAYRKSYQPEQQGEIGMIIWFRWFEPLSNSTSDIEAAQRATDFTVGWFVDVVLNGDYPAVMRELVGSRLPTFTEEQSASLRGSVDVLGVNAVTGIYATYGELQTNTSGYFEDWQAKLTAYRDGVAIGEYVGEYSVPWCMKKIIDYMKIHYDNFPFYITALGWGLDDAPLDETVLDYMRVHFMANYSNYLIEGIRDGGNVRGLFIWSLIDGFETTMGLLRRFGLYYVDGNFVRYPRLSASWFKAILSNNTDGLALATGSSEFFTRKEENILSSNTDGEFFVRKEKHVLSSNTDGLALATGSSELLVKREVKFL